MALPALTVEVASPVLEVVVSQREVELTPRWAEAWRQALASPPLEEAASLLQVEAEVAYRQLEVALQRQEVMASPLKEEQT